jgi:hypothetical protein
LRLFQNFSFGETSFACPATLKNAVLQGFSLKNRKSLQAQAWSKTVRFSAQSISFGTGSNGMVSGRGDMEQEKQAALVLV